MDLGRPLLRAQLPLEDCDRGQKVVTPTAQGSGEERIRRLRDVMNPGPPLFLGDVGLDQFDAPLKVGKQGGVVGAKRRKKGWLPHVFAPF
ncbi:hypothetical protein ACVI1J_001494 [Bradyrhizobium diazoefficiens]